MSKTKGGIRICAFPPILGKNPHTLILGTMPGVRSLKENRYYAHPQNQFWRLMGDIYGASPDLPYDKRLTVLKNQGIAVWDVLQSCIREGSMDSDIKLSQSNDFQTFFGCNPTINRVVFDSLKAEELFKKIQGNFLLLEFCRVPSPSPAHARLRYAEKLAIWKEVLIPSKALPASSRS